MNIIPDIVILHCAATPDFTKDDPSFDKFGASDVDFWHRKRGFDSCGYHFIIRRSGCIETGRKWNTDGSVEMGAHCKGENDHSIAVCYIGTSKPTIEQIESIITLYHRLKHIFGIDKTRWFAHYQFNPNKTCPGLSIDFIRNLLPNA